MREGEVVLVRGVAVSVGGRCAGGLPEARCEGGGDGRPGGGARSGVRLAGRDEGGRGRVEEDLAGLVGHGAGTPNSGLGEKREGRESLDSRLAGMLGVHRGGIRYGQETAEV